MALYGVFADIGCRNLYKRQPLQESLYQTADARDFIRQRMHETLKQTADAGDFIRQRMQESQYQTANIREYIRQRMQESLYQTADAGVSISDSGARDSISDSGC